MAHRPGTFCFAELVTPREDAAKEFYGDLFEWTTLDVLSTSGGYALFQAGGKTVTGLRHVDHRPQQWIPYVLVTSIDDALSRARELGGVGVDAPFDVPGVARMATFRDPAGRVVGLWEDNGSTGAELQEAPGSMWWVELLASDAASARDFYRALFGWEASETSFSHMKQPYGVFKAGGEPVGGLVTIEAEWDSVSEAWQVLFAVRDVDSMVARVKGLGGSQGFAVTVPNVGRCTGITDDEGALLVLMQANPK